jgi:hypothetical protein
MKKIATLTAIALLTAGLTTTVLADTGEALQEPVEKPAVTQQTKEPETVTADFISQVSQHFAVPQQEVEKANVSGIEQGELFFTFFFANKSGKTPEEISKLKVEGKGWGEMVKGFNLGPGAHGKAMGEFRSKK